MATADLLVRHFFGGGWATDFGPTTDASPSSNGLLAMPFLIDAENVLYELDGGPRKIPGTAKLNSTTFESGEDILGLFDFWIQGTAGAPAQHRIVHVGTKIKKDDGDASFSDLFTGMENGAIPSYSVLTDILVIASDSTSDVPKSWDGSTAQNLAGSPPNFAFMETHHNRMWAAGNVAAPSTLYYTANLDPEDWVGSGSGSISIEPEDGDRITGIISYNNELIVFKGPYKGSIHRITGTSPTGDDAFARKILINKGLGACCHRLVFRFGNDVGFVWSDGTVRSLSATAQFGDLREASLSQPIDNEFIAKRVNFGSLSKGHAAVDSTRSTIFLSLPIDSSTVPNAILAFDYRFQPGRWALITAFAGGSLNATASAVAIDQGSNDQRVVLLGCADGFIRKFNQSERSIDGTTAISYKVTSPFMSYGVPITKKTISETGIGIQPKNNGDIVMNFTRDGNAAQSITFAQSGADVLGVAASNQFTLGTSALGGSRYIDIFDATGVGEFRSIQFQFTNSTNYEDVEIHNFSAAVKGGSWATEL